MFEFIQLCITPVNLPLTILLGAVFAYWLLIIFGVLGLDTFDVDIDADADLDVDVDADADVQSGGVSIGFLKFFNIGEVPLMIVISFFIGSLWFVSLVSNYYLNSDLSVLVALLWFGPNLALSLILTKLVTTPFRPLFRNMNAGISAPVKIVGQTCVIKTSEVTQAFGQAEITQAGAPITINVRTEKGHTLGKGDRALVVAHNQDKDTYVVVPYDLES